MPSRSDSDPKSADLAKLEEIAEVVEAFESEFSKTGDFIARVREMTPIGYHDRYEQFLHRLHRAQALATVNFPRLHGKLRKLNGAANSFWGAEQEVLWKCQKQEQSPDLEKVHKQSEAVESVCREVIREIGDIGEQIRNNRKAG